MSYDAMCLSLAEYFLQDVKDGHLVHGELAQAIQDAVEEFISDYESQQEQKDG